MYAVIQLPDFALQAALRHEPELRSRAVAVLDPETKPPVVLQANANAREHGVTRGLTATQALGRCAELISRNRSAGQERSATSILLQTAAGFSPYLESTAPGVCTISLRGLHFPDDAAFQRWAGRIIATLAGFQLEARVGFAPTPGLALLAAQAATPILVVRNDSLGISVSAAGSSGEAEKGRAVPVEDRKTFVFKIPVESLRPSPEIADVLRLWGVQSIGEFLALGKANVAERLGPAAAALFDGLDVIRPLEIVTPPEIFGECVEFPGEIETTAPLLLMLRRILEQLTKRLELVYLVAAELELRLTLASGNQHLRVFRIPAPTNNLQVLFRMLETHLETLRTDSAIVALELLAQPGNPGQHQFGLFEATLRSPNQFAETLARLTALCGPENAGTPQLEATHRPDAFRMTPPTFADSPEEAVADPAAAARQTGRQLRRFRPAQPAAIEFAGGQPAAIRCEAARGAVMEVRGPFHNSGGWWDGRGWAREEWDARTSDGVLCRVVRTGEGCFVEGVYD